MHPEEPTTQSSLEMQEAEPYREEAERLKVEQIRADEAKVEPTKAEEVGSATVRVLGIKAEERRLDEVKVGEFQVDWAKTKVNNIASILMENTSRPTVWRPHGTLLTAYSV
jgi:hypothetical protein